MATYPHGAINSTKHGPADLAELAVPAIDALAVDTASRRIETVPTVGALAAASRGAVPLRDDVDQSWGQMNVTPWFDILVLG